MFFVTADHIQLEHGNRPVERKERMMNVVAASKQSLFFSSPGTQENAACQRGESIAECFRQLQNSRGPGTVIVRTIPDLSACLNILVILRSDDHALVLH